MSDSLEPCPFCNGEVKRQKSDPEMMVHVGMYKCVFGLSAFSVEKRNRRTYKERQEKGSDNA